ncbi:MAG: ABC transporter substrate-binding protein [Desulfococcaceae bacterium]
MNRPPLLKFRRTVDSASTFGPSPAALPRQPPAWAAFLLFIFFPLTPFHPLIPPAAGEEPILRLQLRWRHQFQFAGFYAAERKGFFRDAGLNVQILEGGEGVDAVEEVLSGRAQFGVGNAELVLHYLEGAPLVALAPILQHSPLVLMSRQGDRIRHPKDLIGRRVKMMLTPRDAEIMAMFQREGISLDEVEVVQGWVRPEDFLKPELAAVTAYATNEPYYLQSRGISVSFLRPATYGIDFYGDTLFSRRDVLEEHPDMVRRFRAACIRGWKYALTHPREIIQSILDDYGGEKSYDHLHYEAETIRGLISSEIVEIGYMNPGRWRHIADTFIRLGMVEPGMAMDDFLYDPEPPPPVWLGFAGWIIAGLAILGLFSAMVLMAFNQRLSQKVGERTRSLTRVNLQLQEEVEERRRAQADLNRLREAQEERIRERTLELEAINRKLRDEVNQRRETERALRESQAEKQAILDGISSLLIFIDRRRRVRWANRSASEFFGYPAEELVGIECQALWGTSSDTCRECPTPKVIETRKRCRGKIRSAEGRIWDKRSEPVLDADGRLLGVLEISDDVTEQEKMAAQLRQVRQMEAVGELAAGLAHEFNNALFGITGHVELLRKSPMAPQEVQRHTGQVLKSADRMIRLTDRMLAFSCNGRYDLKPLRLNRFVEGVLNREKRFRRSDIEWEISLSADPDLVAADPEQLARAVTAILTNAEEAVPFGGRIVVQSWNRNLKEPPPGRNFQAGECVVLTITDNGVGMTEAVRERMFEPFFSTKFLGRGMGLSSTYGIIRNHGGWLEVASEAGAGSTVHVHLKASEDKLDSLENGKSESAGSPSARE